MLSMQEQITQIMSELDALTQRCTSQTYVSHYTLQQRYGHIVASYESLDDAVGDDVSQRYTALRCTLDAALQTLKEKNEEKMLTIDFKRACMGLIRRNDLENLKDLIDIAEYFGVGQGTTRMDVTSALYLVYDAFNANRKLCIPDAKPCVDYICDVLREGRFFFPPASRTATCTGTLYGQGNLTETLQSIFEYDDVNRLMVWMVDSSAEDIAFALRLAASSQTSAPPNCLMFLLRRTKPDDDCMMPVSLLAVAADKPGKPSTKQTAMHRVVRSGNTQTALMMLNHEFNPSHDLLRQLIARDRNDERPIDYINKIEDVVSQSLMIKRIRTALDTYKAEKRYGLGEDICKSIIKELDTLDADLRSSHDFSGPR